MQPLIADGDKQDGILQRIETWSIVELRLLTLLAGALQASSAEAVTEVFMSPEGFRGKLKMVDAALRNSKQVNVEMPEWERLLTGCRKGSAIRNELAHHTVYFDPGAAKSRRFFLARGGVKGIDSRKSVAELSVVKENFYTLSAELFQFAMTMRPRTQR
jgi:hypothetical protein